MIDFFKFKYHTRYGILLGQWQRQHLSSDSVHPKVKSSQGLCVLWYVRLLKKSNIYTYSQKKLYTFWNRRNFIVDRTKTRLVIRSDSGDHLDELKSHFGFCVSFPNYLERIVTTPIVSLSLSFSFSLSLFLSWTRTPLTYSHGHPDSV